MFGTAALVLGSSAPSLVSNSYTLDDYKIYRLVKFLGIGFLINFVKGYVENWCISANCKKIREFFEGSKEEDITANSSKCGCVRCTKRSIGFNFGEYNMKFDLYESTEDPSEIELHKILSKGKYDREIDSFTNLSENYSWNTSALRVLENTKFLKEVYDSFVGMKLDAICVGANKITFNVTDDCKVSFDFKLGATAPSLEISNVYKGKNENFELCCTGENEKNTLSIDEMRVKIEKIKNFYKEEVQKSKKVEENLQKGGSQEIIDN